MLLRIGRNNCGGTPSPHRAEGGGASPTNAGSAARPRNGCSPRRCSAYEPYRARAQVRETLGTGLWTGARPMTRAFRKPIELDARLTGLFAPDHSPGARNGSVGFRLFYDFWGGRFRNADRLL